MGSSIDTAVDFLGSEYPHESMRLIAAAVESVISDMLSRTWKELDYRLDACRVTDYANINI